MTKKHFIDLAGRIRDHNQTDNQLEPFTAGQLEVLADFCSAINPRFNRDRWQGYIAGENGPCGGRV